MICKFGVENYKSIKAHDVKLFPLTILSGVNNTGKTTFIQSILELVRYYEEDTMGLSVMPILSNYRTKVLNHNIENDVMFNMTVELDNSKNIEVDIKYHYNEKAKGGYVSYCKLSYKSTDDEKIRILILEKSKPLEPYKIYAKDCLSILFGNIKQDTDLPEIFEGMGDFEFMGNIPLQGKIYFKNNTHLSSWFEKSDDDDYIQVSVNIAKIFLGRMFNVKYIGPLRSYPKEFYFLEQRGLEIDSFGKNTIEVLERLQNKKINFYKNTKDKTLTNMRLLESVQYWLSFFYGKIELELSMKAENLVQVLINGHTINNSGFGFSQLLPIVVQALLLRKNELLLLEQPEIHLHPELEEKLAYFLLCIVRNKRQIIAETHSEHIVNELVISKMKDDSIENYFRIYFLNQDETGSTNFKKIKIGEYGEVINWPKGFFDQYLNFSKKIVALRKEKANKTVEKK